MQGLPARAGGSVSATTPRTGVAASSLNTVEEAVSLLQEHAVSLLRQADRHSLCRDDAYDA